MTTRTAFYFVPLAPVRDPGLVPSTIAQSIGLQDARDRPLMEHLVSQLRERRLLIVLDNFEHLLPAAPVVTQLLQETSTLRILVSSRSPLRVSGEQECPVPPLDIPAVGSRPTAASLAACESVRLFAERAAAAAPEFTVSDENAPAIAQIARRLDGLPLAIELAAARCKLLPPEAIVPRLEHSLGLLTGGSRDLEDRQQTLRATIAWSYDLLTEGARRLLAACSVFAGGASLEVIETVCDAALDLGLPVLDGLQELVDQSLLRQVRSPGPSPARYAMLETIREYAAERLDAMAEADQVRGAHAAAFLALIETGGRPQAGLATKEWLERVDIEHNNIRAALAWYRQHDPPAALRLAASMSAFWSLRGHHTEGRQRLGELLALVPEASMIRVSALNGAAWLAIDQGDYADAAGLLAEQHRTEPRAGRHGWRGHRDGVPRPLHDVQRADRGRGTGRGARRRAGERGRRSPGYRVHHVLLRPGRIADWPPGSRLRPVRPLRCAGCRARPGAAERTRPADARLPASRPGRAVRGQDGAC